MKNFLFNLGNSLNLYIDKKRTQLNMKRIEAYFQFGRLETVVEAVEKAGAEGLTVVYARGRGSAERIPIQSNRGTTVQRPLFNIIDGLVTIVEDHLVEPVVDAIKKNANNDVKGIIIVSDVHQIIKI
ncbi:P-II family nitrogen regulator [Candidatus Parcubacteria bacterium]|nr:MAG: P-II family nitrogen regulator [Candidatus Parcubacteria bacterium]